MRPGKSPEMQCVVWVNAEDLSVASFEPGLLIRCPHSITMTWAQIGRNARRPGIENQYSCSLEEKSVKEPTRHWLPSK